ncbi:MAG: ribonuclease HII [Ignavibacteria bacterium]
MKSLSKLHIPDNQIEHLYWEQGLLVAGVDEAGRGSLAGPVVAASVVFPKGTKNEIGCRDSKLMSVQDRESAFELILNDALEIGIGITEVDIIDTINIRNATVIAMQESLASLHAENVHALIDGNHFIHDSIPFTTIIKGDYHCFSIAAASIVAKVTRDRIMQELDDKVAALYYFAQNKGYGTAKHRESLVLHGPSAYHRRTFLRKILGNE